MRRRELILTLLSPLLVSGGCRDKGELEIKLGRKDGQPRLTMRNLTVAFEGVVSQGRNAPEMTTFVVKTRGAPGETTEQTTAASMEGIQVLYRLVGGVPELTIAGQSFYIIEDGRKVQFKDNAYDLGRRVVVYVSGDGKTREAYL